MKRLTFFMVAIMALCLTAIAQKQSSKTLVAYFSATGTTEKAAKVVAEVTGGTLYEIQPAKKYTSADLDWHDKSSRSSVEMADAKSRPALSSKAENLADYDTVYIGFPIWWNLAPRIITTFIESSDFSGKTVGYVSNFNRFSKLYRVQIQADPTYRVTPESLNHIYVRTGEGMAPLAQFVQLTKTYGPQDMSRFNLYNSISVNGTPASGYSSGDALKAVQETAEKLLPANYAYEFGGISREESQTTNNVAIIFAICMVLIYLILCALYESLLIPFSIILSVPCGFLGSFLFAQILGLENNIYMQTGLIMLIGLLAKTAILQTEYAVQRRKAGMSLIQAAYVAAKDRLRPILMTVMAMIFGLLPLMMAHGVGANGCRSLASGVVGGMLIGTLALLLFVPVLFIVFQYLQEKIRPAQTSCKDADWAIQTELENLKIKE